MKVLFCRPDAPQDIDDRFELEALALDELALDHAVIAMEDVVDGVFDALDDAVRDGDDVLYRGWMLSGEEYAALHDAIGERGAALITDPAEYEAAHYLPEWHPVLGARTIPARWTTGTDAGELWELAQELGPPPYVLKDHVKSAKERWHDACLVPAGATRADFARTVEALVDHRGDRFERGLVVRPYVALLPDEHRLWFWRGRLVTHTADGLDVSAFASLGRHVASPFFTVDIAERSDGGWIVVEVGDGGVSTIPDTMDPRELYRRTR